MGEKSKENLDILYDNQEAKRRKPWDSIIAPCKISNLLSFMDIQYLNKIARSNKSPKEKKTCIDDLMRSRGFKRLAAGTNRITYKYMENQQFVIKVAFDSVALQDSPNEYINQEYLKPFCAKCFEVTPCGTVGLFERVVPVMHIEEFEQIAGTVFNIIVNCFIGKYIMADFGTNCYKNWGVRVGAFPVILDYPYLYELDKSKLICSKPEPNSPTGYCGGDIDYDSGFNRIMCTKCGKVYRAAELAKKDFNNNTVLYSGKEKLIPMKITITKRDGGMLTVGNSKESDTYKKKETRREYKERKSLQQLKVFIEKADRSEEEKKSDYEETSSQVVENETISDEEMFEPVDMTDPEDNMKITITTRKGKVIKPHKPTPMSYSEYYNQMYGTGVVIDDSETETEVDTSESEDVETEVDEKSEPEEDVETVSGTVEDTPADFDPTALARAMQGNTISKDTDDAVTVYSSDDVSKDQMDEFM